MQLWPTDVNKLELSHPATLLLSIKLYTPYYFVQITKMICFLSRFDRNNKLDRLINKNMFLQSTVTLFPGWKLNFNMKEFFGSEICLNINCSIQYKNKYAIFLLTRYKMIAANPRIVNL